MSKRVRASTAIRKVGAPRHPFLHLGRAISAEQTVYILHPTSCLAVHSDLRTCPYSRALDRGINVLDWTEDQTVVLDLADGWLKDAGVYR